MKPLHGKTVDLPYEKALAKTEKILADEGFGVRVVEKLFDKYEFPDNVTLVDGGVLGINLLLGSVGFALWWLLKKRRKTIY